MTAQTNQPAKFLVPFAQNDSSRVELPVTTSDATRASQSLGFPPTTMQPPEAGGVPPQGEDFNGALNQVARIAWWLMLGGEFAFDAAFATATQIGGYPKGAVLQGADFLGNWISTVDNNTTNPDTSTDPAGGGYVPGYQYGTTALSGLTGGAVTLTNAQAAKRTITLAGTLTSALTLVVPTWQKEWVVTNNTTGAFAATIKTAAGTGIAIPQNGAPTPVVGDGTNIVQPSQNVAPAVQGSQAAQLSQAGFQNLAVYRINSGTLQVSVNGGAFTSVGASAFIVPPSGRYKARLWGGGGGGGSAFAGAAATGGAGAGYAESVFTGATPGASLPITVGLGGAGATGSNNGSAGGTSSVGSAVSATGGGGGVGAATGTASGTTVVAGSGTGASLIVNGQGVASAYPIASSTTVIASGGGGAFGTPGSAISVAGATGAAFPGGGGGGGANNNVGAAGANGCVIIEY